MNGLIKLLELLKGSEKELIEAKKKFSEAEGTFNKNDAIVIDDIKADLNISLRNSIMIKAQREHRIKNEKNRDSIEHIKCFFHISQGRNSSDYVEFCAVDSEEDFDKISQIPDFYWVNINDEAFDYIKSMIKQSVDNDKVDEYTDLFFNDEAIEYLINELEEFEIALNYYPTFEIFINVITKVYGESSAKYISNEYIEVWQELRDGIQLVCRQMGEFFYLCRENNKCVFMLGV